MIECSYWFLGSCVCIVGRQISVWKTQLRIRDMVMYQMDWTTGRIVGMRREPGFLLHNKPVSVVSPFTELNARCVWSLLMGNPQSHKVGVEMKWSWGASVCWVILLRTERSPSWKSSFGKNSGESRSGYGRFRLLLEERWKFQMFCRFSMPWCATSACPVSTMSGFFSFPF